jgi:hypothetical protein
MEVEFAKQQNYAVKKLVPGAMEKEIICIETVSSYSELPDLEKTLAKQCAGLHACEWSMNKIRVVRLCLRIIVHLRRQP